MSWHLLEKSLDEVSKQSTVFGKLWVTFLFIFRVIAVTRIGETIYADEQSSFKCNIKQVGCENVCFNEFSPISHVRFWGFQIIIVATPAMMFIVYTTHAVSCIPSAKLVRGRLEFLRGKKQPKSRVSKNTSKTTQSSAKRTTSTVFRSSLQRINAKSKNKGWTKEKRELVTSWNIVPDPAPIHELISLKKPIDLWNRDDYKEGNPPLYYEKFANLYFEQASLKNVSTIDRYDDNNKLRWDTSSQINSDVPRSYSRKNGLFKEVPLNQIRSHSDGELNRIINLKEPQSFSNASKLYRFAQVSQTSNSPPHYSVIHLSHLADISLKAVDSPAAEAERERFYLSPAAPFTKSISTLRKKNIVDRSQQTRPFSASFPGKTLRSCFNSQTQHGSDPTTTGRSVAKPSKRLSSREALRKDREVSIGSENAGYLEFAKRVENIERKIALAYFMQSVLRLLLEIAFLYLQYRMFNFQVPELFKCQRWPCPNIVDCYVSRPEEKSLMLYFMFYLTGFCIGLAFCEILFLICRHASDCYKRQKLINLWLNAL